MRRINMTHPERKQWLTYKPETDKDGYLIVRIRRKKWPIHRLVYLLFVGPLIDGLVVCHKDNSRSNNHWTNLLQATQKVNISHKKVHGTHQQGETKPNSMHTNAQASSVKDALVSAKRSKTGRLRRGEAKRIAEEIGTSIHLVYDLSTKETKWC